MIFEQTNGQGNDIGEQYKSAIFYYTETQRQIAENIKQVLEQKNYQVTTDIREVKPYYLAEDYHLDYYLKNGSEPYCHSYKKNILDKLVLSIKFLIKQISIYVVVDYKINNKKENKRDYKFK